MSKVATATLGPTDTSVIVFGVGSGDGFRVRILAYKIDVAMNTYTSDAAGVAVFQLATTSLASLLELGISYLPASAPSTATGAYSTGWMELGEGVTPESWAPDEDVSFESSKTIGGGMVMISIRYDLEDTALPRIVDVVPPMLSTAGGEVLTIYGYNLGLSGLPVLEVDGEALFTAFQSSTVYGFTTVPHVNSTPGVGTLPVVATTSAGSDTWDGVLFYNASDLPTINSLDISTLAAGAIDTITATGTDFNAGSWNNCDQVGFFSVAPPTGKPPDTTAALVGLSPATFIGSTSITFEIGALGPGVYYVVPDTTHCPHWFGTSQVTLTVT